MGKNMTVVVTLGIGLGLIMDVFIPSLRLETDREEELLVYRDSLSATILLFLLIVFFTIATFLLLN